MGKQSKKHEQKPAGEVVVEKLVKKRPSDGSQPRQLSGEHFNIGNGRDETDDQRPKQSSSNERDVG